MRSIVGLFHSLALKGGNRSLGKGSTSSLGKRGEVEASRYLQRKGYQILETNYRALRGEIDIIARKRKEIAFVEVKSGRSLDFGPPLEKVDARKQKQIAKVALAYLQSNSLEEVPCRFDVLSVTEENGSIKIEHIEDAFQV